MYLFIGRLYEFGSRCISYRSKAHLDKIKEFLRVVGDYRADCVIATCFNALLLGLLYNTCVFDMLNLFMCFQKKGLLYMCFSWTII